MLRAEDRAAGQRRLPGVCEEVGERVGDRGSDRGRGGALDRRRRRDEWAHPVDFRDRSTEGWPDADGVQGGARGGSGEWREFAAVTVQPGSPPDAPETLDEAERHRSGDAEAGERRSEGCQIRSLGPWCVTRRDAVIAQTRERTSRSRRGRRLWGGRESARRSTATVGGFAGIAALGCGSPRTDAFLARLLRPGGCAGCGCGEAGTFEHARCSSAFSRAHWDRDRKTKEPAEPGYGGDTASLAARTGPPAQQNEPLAPLPGRVPRPHPLIAIPGRLPPLPDETAWTPLSPQAVNPEAPLPENHLVGGSPARGAFSEHPHFRQPAFESGLPGSRHIERHAFPSP